MWYLVVKNLDFSMRTVRRQLKDLIYGILSLVFIMLFFIFVGFIFDMITFYKFYDVYITDQCTTIIQVFGVKMIQGCLITVICGGACCVIFECIEKCKHEWVNFKNVKL